MHPEIIYPSTEEIRKKPINLDEKDIRLFSHEYNLRLQQVHRFEFQNIQILRNVIFSLRKFKFYPLLTHIFQTPKKYFIKRLRLFLKPAKHIDEGIWVLDEISAEYFHWFTDALTRLLALELTSKTGQNTLKTIPVLLPEAYRDKPYISASLQMLGYTVNYYNTRKRLQVDKLISCTHTAPTGNYNSMIINVIRTRLMKQKNDAPERKIYISRANASKRKITNEQEVVRLLQQYSYEIHTFEDYNFEQQLLIMAATTSLVSIHGAGLTNMLFMPAGGQILELRNEGDSHNNCYFTLASSLSHDYYYLNNKGDQEDTNGVNLTVDINELIKVLGLMR